MISFQTLALLLNIAAALAFGIGALRKSTMPGARGLFALAMCAAIVSAGFLLYDAPSTGSQRLLWEAVIYLSSTVGVSALLGLALEQTGKPFWSKGRNVLLLAVMPVATQVFFWTASWRGPFFHLDGMPASSSILLAGPWGKISGIYILGLTAGSLILLWEAFAQRRLSILSPLGDSILGAAFPAAVLSLDFAGWSIFPNVELWPFALTLAAAGTYLGLFRPRSNEMAPVDRAAAVEGMDEGWMVLDSTNKIVDINAAAEKLSGLTRQEVVGQQISSVLGDLPNLGEMINGSQELEMKSSVPSAEGWRHLDIRISPLLDRHQNRVGRLALWRDTTDRKMVEDARQLARDEMFALINAISSAANNTLSVDDFLLESIYHIISPFRSQAVGVFLIDDRNKDDEPRLILASYLGIPAASAEALNYVPASSPLFDWVIKHRQPFLVEEAKEDARVPAAVRRLGIGCFLLIPLTVQAAEDSKLLGCMFMARAEKPSFSQDEIVRLTTISEHVANLIDSDRRRRREITSTERKRMMRDLHDSVSQKLYGLVTATEAAQAALEAGSYVDPALEFARIGENARQAVREMRLFLYQLQQIDIDKDGLVSVLHHRLAAVEGRANIKARLLAAEDLSLSKDKEMALYYIAQEALNNVLRHAHAKSVLVTLKQGQRNVILEIRDDGCGFDPKEVDRTGLGLENIRERTAQIDGTLKIVSKPNHGTKIVVTVRKDRALATPKPGVRS